MMKRTLALLMMLMLLIPCAYAEEMPIVTVNGEDLPYSEYVSIESAYMYQYQVAGVNLSDPTTYAYLQDLALTYAVEQMLVRQDMQAQGCYEFDAETEVWFAQTGKESYEAALNDVKASLLAGDPTLTADELHVYALAYAESLGVTEATYVDFYRTQYASANYYAWLTRETPVTDEDVQSAYAQRVEESKALYENDAAAFETAIRNGAEVWYSPVGYRSVLQILLPAEGASAEEKLASTEATVAEITARLEQGEAFESLIREYGTDTAFTDESFFTTGNGRTVCCKRVGNQNDFVLTFDFFDKTDVVGVNVNTHTVNNKFSIDITVVVYCFVNTYTADFGEVFKCTCCICVVGCKL